MNRSTAAFCSSETGDPAISRSRASSPPRPGQRPRLARARRPRRTCVERDPGYRLTATRLPGTARDDVRVGAFADPRTRAVATSRGRQPHLLPDAEARPPVSVPVTTVPKPATVKTRSTGNRGRLPGGRGGTASSTSSRVRRKLVQPLTRVSAETGDDRRVAPRVDPATRSRVSSRNQVEPIRLHGVGFG